jgi:IMP dehydrogenase
MTETGFSFEDVSFSIPILASAMDAIVNPSFAVKMHEVGGLGVMNLEGVQARYDDPDEVLAEIVKTPKEGVTALLQKLYTAPIREDLMGTRVEEVKRNGATCAVSFTPANTKRMAPVAVEAGADIVVVQSTVTTARHTSKSAIGLRFPELLELIDVPVLVGNCVSYDVTLELMETGIHGVLVGVGPGAACTTREVTGVGVPQVTATLECAAAREEYKKRTGRHVPIITDGGIRTGGDLCKTFACGAAPHPALPRGTRVSVGVKGPLEQILFGPSSLTDGTQNLIGALRVCMGMVGALTIQDMHSVEVVVAPAIKTEGKHLQMGFQ